MENIKYIYILLFILIISILASGITIAASTESIKSNLCFKDKEMKDTSDCVSDVSNGFIYSGAYTFVSIIILLIYIIYNIITENKRKLLNENNDYFSMFILGLFVVVIITIFGSLTHFITYFFDDKVKECKCYNNKYKEYITGGILDNNLNLFPMTKLTNSMVLLSFISLIVGAIFGLFVFFLYFSS